MISELLEVNLFICADDEFRKIRGTNVYHKDLATLKKEDAKRASYYNYYTGLNWGEPKDYDLIINIARTGIEGAVKVIKEYVANNPK